MRQISITEAINNIDRIMEKAATEKSAEENTTPEHRVKHGGGAFEVEGPRSVSATIGYEASTGKFYNLAKEGGGE